jgi:hypothetical protein
MADEFETDEVTKFDEKGTIVGWSIVLFMMLCEHWLIV